MNFDLSEGHLGCAVWVRRFAHDKLAPGALKRAHSTHCPWDVAAMLAEQGLLGIAFSEADGGQGGTLMHAVLAIQEVALACPKSADIVAASAIPVVGRSDSRWNCRRASVVDSLQRPSALPGAKPRDTRRDSTALTTAFVWDGRSPQPAPWPPGPTAAVARVSTMRAGESG